MREFNLLEEFLSIAVNLASTLWEVHKKNIIHKDIYPSNILIDHKSHEARLIDFGLAYLLQRE